MSGEPVPDPSERAVDALHREIAHMRELWDEREKRYEQRFQAQETAVLKAEQAFEERLKNTNEWRAAMNDRDQRMMTRAEVEALFKSVDGKSDGRFLMNTEKIDDAKARITRIEGRTGGISALVGYIFGGIMALGVIIDLVIRK
jgi:hypothetical protein